MIRFVVPGPPIGKGRPRATRQGGHVRMYTPAATRAYEARIADAAYDALTDEGPIDGPVSVHATAVFAIPASWPKRRREAAQWHTGKPDADNIGKAVGDGLNGVAFRDDTQVAAMTVRKVYGETPGLHVEVVAL